MLPEQLQQQQTPPTPLANPGPQPQNNSGLDPALVHLAQAIRHEESGGNFKSEGKSGEYGAYQYTPDTWAANSAAAGVNVPLRSSTPEQQNEVAYKTLSTWKQEHPDWDIGNFASAWNAGPHDPNAYLEDHTGVNSYGVAYDTPAYAARVADTYQKIKAGQLSPAPAQDGNTTPEATNPAVAKQNNPLFTWLSGLPMWEKVALGVGVGGTAVAAGALTGGAADLPFLGALGIGGEAAAEGGAAAATAGAAGTAGSILSKLGGLASKAAPIAEGVGIAEAADKFLGGKTQAAPNQNTNPVASASSFTDQSHQQSNQAHDSLIKAQQSMLGQTPTGRVALQDPATQQGINANAKYGTVATSDENGIADTTAAEEKRDKLIEELSNGNSEMLDAEGNHGNLNDAVSEAKSGLHAYAPMREWEEGEKHIDDEANRYRKFADERGNVPLSLMEKIRKEQGKARGNWDSSVTSAKRAAHKQLYFGARKTIEKNTDSKELYNHAMKEEQALLNGRKVNKRLNGKKIPVPNGMGKRIAERIAQYASIAIGDKIGGPLGAIVGAVVGHSLERAIEKKVGKNILDTKSFKKAFSMVEEKRPEVAQLLKSAIAKYGNRQAAEKEYNVIKKDKSFDTPQEREAIEKEMGTYQLGKNKTTGRVGLTGLMKKPGVVVNPTGIEESSPFTRRKSANDSKGKNANTNRGVNKS